MLKYFNVKLFAGIFVFKVIMNQLEVYFSYSLGAWAQDTAL
jgi:hypothetical protein